MFFKIYEIYSMILYIYNYICFTYVDWKNGSDMFWCFDMVFTLMDTMYRKEWLPKDWNVTIYTAQMPKIEPTRMGMQLSLTGI